MTCLISVKHKNVPWSKGLDRNTGASVNSHNNNWDPTWFSLSGSFNHEQSRDK